MRPRCPQWNDNGQEMALRFIKQNKTVKYHYFQANATRKENSSNESAFKVMVKACARVISRNKGTVG